jgi:hypothetical protein
LSRSLRRSADGANDANAKDQGAGNVTKESAAGSWFVGLHAPEPSTTAERSAFQRVCVSSMMIYSFDCTENRELGTENSP